MFRFRDSWKGFGGFSSNVGEASDKLNMFDPVVVNSGRLRILTALAAGREQDFVGLRRTTRLTDGNLASHARRLRVAGFIEIDKLLRAGKPVTQFRLTPAGQSALEGHARELLAAIEGTTAEPVVAGEVVADELSVASEDVWVD